jgi:hypothetical protein
MSVTIIRYQGNWVYFVDGVMINPVRAGSVPTFPLVYAPPAPIPNPDLDSATDLIAGIFYTTPLDNAVEPTVLQSFQAEVNSITLPPPVITTQPVSQVVKEGNVAFSMTVGATFAVSYQWYQNNVALTGQTNYALIIPDVEPANAGVYKCAVIGVGGALNTVTSSSATLAVLIPLPGASTAVNFATSENTGGITDVNGNTIGLSTYYPTTGSWTPSQENPNLEIGGGVLDMFNATADWNGANLANMTAPAVDLATLGFTGTQDFNATVTFGPISIWYFPDQAGLLIGDGGLTGHTRAGFIGDWWPYADTAAGGFACNNTANLSNSDQNGNDGLAMDVSQGMTVTIGRTAGTWYWAIDGEEDYFTSPWYGEQQPNGTFSSPNLNLATDLYAGFFVDSPFGASDGVSYPVESFAARVFAAPQILASRSGSTMNLTWNVVGLGLVSSTDLVTWTPVAGTANRSTLAVTIPPTGNRYYGIAPLP